MSVPTAAAGPWPARCAYISAAIFLAASGTANVVYGYSKGSDLASSLVWAGVAGAVALLAALAWPAFIRSIEARRWSAAAMAFVALALATTYSTVAALGSAAGARMQAAASETATTGIRQRAEADYAAAKADLAKLGAARPVAELEPLVEAARPICRVRDDNRQQRNSVRETARHWSLSWGALGNVSACRRQPTRPAPCLRADRRAWPIPTAALSRATWLPSDSTCRPTG